MLASYRQFSVLCLLLLHVVCFFQILLHSLQCFGAVLPDNASSPATRAVPLLGPFPQAGDPEPGGGGRPGPQLEG